MMARGRAPVAGRGPVVSRWGSMSGWGSMSRWGSVLPMMPWRRAMVTGRVEASRRGVVLLVIYVLLLPSLLRRGALSLVLILL